MNATIPEQPQTRMKALSIRQPSGVRDSSPRQARGKPDVVTRFAARSQSTPKKWGRDRKKTSNVSARRSNDASRHRALPLHLGYLVGTARLIDCVRPADVPEGQERGRWVIGASSWMTFAFGNNP